MSENWNGHDPRLRTLRSVSAIVVLGLFCFVILDGQPNDAATLGTLVGALLVILGFEVGLRFPGTGGKSDS